MITNTYFPKNVFLFQCIEQPLSLLNSQALLLVFPYCNEIVNTVHGFFKCKTNYSTFIKHESTVNSLFAKLEVDLLIKPKLFFNFVFICKL